MLLNQLPITNSSYFVTETYVSGSSDSALGNYLVFLRRVTSSNTIQSFMVGKKWTDILMTVIQRNSKGNPFCVRPVFIYSECIPVLVKDSCIFIYIVCLNTVMFCPENVKSFCSALHKLLIYFAKNIGTLDFKCT